MEVTIEVKLYDTDKVSRLATGIPYEPYEVKRNEGIVIYKVEGDPDFLLEAIAKLDLCAFEANSI